MDHPVHTNKLRFRIPFQYDAQEMARLGAVEIQLFVSLDRGRSWQLSQAVPPSETRFTFQAPGEGEYWFAVRTLDAQRQRHPAGPWRPGLQVLVDQTPPVLHLRLHESTPGRVQLSWSASDDDLDVESLKLEFLDATTPNWQPVAVTPAASGQTSWTVMRGGRVLVRGAVADRAGNSTSADASATIQPGPGGPPRGAPPPATPDFSQPIAGPGTLAPAYDAENDGPTSPLPPAGLAGGPAVKPVQRYPSAVLAEAHGASAPSFRPPATAARPDQLISSEIAHAPAITRDRWGPPAPGPAATQTARRVNSTSFNIAYELEQVGPSGVARVDLYMTEDHGETWYYYGADPDRSSPFQVTVPADGSYGFALRVRSGVGRSEDPPRPGQPPEMTIVVDRTPPRVKLLPVRQGRGETLRQVEIAWEVSDELLAERPVALSWGPQATGPWEPITSWQENTGRLTWTIGPDLPQKLYLRLEARDAAGNIAHAVSAQPLVIDLAQPSARMTDVDTVRLLAPQ